MSLTTAQSATLRSAILAETDAAFVVARTQGATGTMADFYNVLTTTLAWRTSMPPSDSDDAPDYSAFDSLVAGKRDSWALFLNYQRDFTRNKIRKWITDVWGNATASSNAEAVLQAGTRKATRVELLLGGSATATTGTVTALKLAWEGAISGDDVATALGG